jgi:hypothetical protein
MASIKVVGIDWASDEQKRACVELQCNDNREIFINNLKGTLTDDETINICKNNTTAVVAIDTPFGWPKKFINLVSNWNLNNNKKLEVVNRDNFQFRYTDLLIKKEFRNPMSVSSSWLALLLCKWSKIIIEADLFQQIDYGLNIKKDNNKPVIIEVYPYASLKAFCEIFNFKKGSLKYKDPKKKDEKLKKERIKIRNDITDSLFKKFGITCCKQKKELIYSTDHLFDAFICGFTAVVYSKLIKGWDVRRPKEGENPSILAEGWIFYPIKADYQF